MKIELYYCAAKQRHFAEIAIAGGFEYGAQLPNMVYFSPQFVDQDWKAPDFHAYTDTLRTRKPHVASVLDWERDEQLSEVLAWAEEAAASVDAVIVIPKVIGGVARIPERIGGKLVRLGYSVPTRFGGTAVPIWEFGKRPVHLLGGSPQKQMRLSRMLNAVSADGNYIQKMAVDHTAFWMPGTAQAKNRYFPQLQEMDGWTGEGAPYEAFARSVENVMTAWRQLEANRYDDLPLFNSSQRFAEPLSVAGSGIFARSEGPFSATEQGEKQATEDRQRQAAIDG